MPEERPSPPPFSHPDEQSSHTANDRGRSIAPDFPPVSARLGAAPPRANNRRSPWANEFHKFLNLHVEVVYVLGTGVNTLKGKMVAYNAEAHHCIVEEATGRTFVRHPLIIKATH